ncbi:hypothetical protein A2U01_0013471 [Trifolium medium]|uniref:Uncharacterized protein n=1 Tax=Trifolium medium TaxID=97028 RepID=A0A392MYE4_9FABA|nr:hypothetical protein [Trifolium medium]
MTVLHQHDDRHNPRPSAPSVATECVLTGMPSHLVTLVRPSQTRNQAFIDTTHMTGWTSGLVTALSQRKSGNSALRPSVGASPPRHVHIQFFPLSYFFSTTWDTI